MPELVARSDGMVDVRLVVGLQCLLALLHELSLGGSGSSSSHSLPSNSSSSSSSPGLGLRQLVQVRCQDLLQAYPTTAAQDRQLLQRLGELAHTWEGEGVEGGGADDAMLVVLDGGVQGGLRLAEPGSVGVVVDVKAAVSKGDGPQQVQQGCGRGVGGADGTGAGGEEGVHRLRQPVPVPVPAPVPVRAGMLRMAVEYRLGKKGALQCLSSRCGQQVV